MLRLIIRLNFFPFVRSLTKLFVAEWVLKTVEVTNLSFE